MTRVSLDEAINIARQKHNAGNLEEARGIYRQVLQHLPNHPHVLHALGVIEFQFGQRDEGLDLVRRAIAILPNQSLFHSNLARMYRELGRFSETLPETETALRLSPQRLEAHTDYVLALKEAGRLDDAIARSREALVRNPNDFQMQTILGLTLAAAGRSDEAIDALKKAIALSPQQAVTYAHLGAALKARRLMPDAIEAFKIAVRLNPNFGEAQNNLGTSYLAVGEPALAMDAFKEALRIAPNHSVMLNNLGSAQRDLGLVAESIESYRAALRLNPNMPQVHSNLLLALHYLPEQDPRQIFAEHLRWAAQHALPALPAAEPARRSRVSDRRLRIAYFSPNFLQHPVGIFIEPLLVNHDREQFEIFCYSDVPAGGDATTTRLAATVEHWRDVAGMSDAALAAQIRADQIDILVDLAGHTADNRMPLVSMKPAPITASYLGYPDTTGLANVDYRITDALADPPGMTESLHTEKLMRLRCAWCYPIVASAPPVVEAPYVKNGFVTFGCFNHLAKVTGPMIALWCEILRAVPKSRLLIKARGLQSAKVQRRLRDAFAAHGIHEQLELHLPTFTYDQHIAIYDRVDIALDTFPYHGTTTTCQAMWMGAPVITLAGQTHVSRVGVSLLTNAGLPDLIAQTPQEYQKFAIDLANDVSRISELRSTLRERMRASVLMNAKSFAQDVEAAYREMWRTREN